MDQLIKALPGVLQAAGDSEDVAEAAAIAVWKHVAGEGLRPHAAPFRLHNKTLIVAVADAIWQKQLESMAGQLLFRLNSLLGQAVVTFIEFRVDPETLQSAREQHANIAQPVHYEANAFEPLPLELVSAAASIHDHDLRRAFLGAATSCIRRLEKAE
jgi:predicted nucleic acid-binding Zn ribbon protein